MTRILGGVLVVAVVAIFFGGCSGGYAGTQCTSDDECAEGLTCSGTQATAVVGGDCDIVQSICTTACSSDSDCSEWDLTCSASSQCGGGNDRCDTPH